MNANHRHSRFVPKFDMGSDLLCLNQTLDQLSFDYDVYGMEAEQLLELLPPEFEVFDKMSLA